MKWLLRGLAGFILLIVLAFAGLSAASYMNWRSTLADLREVEAPAPYRIERDEWGVPTVYGDTDASTAFALAYAHSEDDFRTIQMQLLAVRGELGAVLGREGAQVDYFGLLLDVQGQVDRGLDQVSPEAMAVAQGYADGLNRYAADHPEEVLRGQMFPVTARDVVGGFVLVSPLFFGVDDVVSDLFESKPLPRSMVAEERGSNAFAIAPSRNADGSTVLISNSHQPWDGAAAWYEARMVSGEGWTMTGALFPGSPVVLMGHNGILGWTNTVNRPDLTDVYELTLDESGKRYMMDGEWRELTKERVWLKVKMGPLTVPVPQTIWRSEHGPVVKNDNGAFAIRYAGYGETRQFEQYWRLCRTKSLAEWREVMAMQAIPATNFIYADREGNIAYLYNARLPERSAEVDWSGVLPGDRSDLIWTQYVPAERIPFLLNPPSGYIVNANNTPYLATAPEDEMTPADHPGLVGIETNITNRILRAKALLAADDSYTAEDLERIKYDKGYDPTSPIGQVVVGLMSAPAASEFFEAEALFDEWDWTLDGEGASDAIALLVIGDIYRAMRQGDPMPELDVTLRKASDHLMTHFDRLDPPMGELFRLRKGDVDVPIYGGPDALRALGWLDIDEDGRLSADFGDSFILFVRWAPDGTVTTTTAQPYGAAVMHPDSPHYDDQAEMFAREERKPVPEFGSVRE